MFFYSSFFKQVGASGSYTQRKLKGLTPEAATIATIKAAVDNTDFLNIKLPPS